MKLEEAIKYLKIMKDKDLCEQGYVYGNEAIETVLKEQKNRIPKKKIKDKIKLLKRESKEALRGLKGQDRYFVKQEYLFKIDTLQELLKGD